MKLVKNKKKTVFLLLVIAFFAGFGYKHFYVPEEISYITQPAKRQSVQKVVNATGEVHAVDLVTVGAQTTGQIEKLYVDVGQTVKKGDMIAEIDSTTQQNEVDINVTLHDGDGSAEAYGCDLTYEYVRINGDYRT